MVPYLFQVLQTASPFLIPNRASICAQQNSRGAVLEINIPARKCLVFTAIPVINHRRDRGHWLVGFTPLHEAVSDASV